MNRTEMDALDIHFDDSYAEKYLLEEINKRRKKYWINKSGERVDISEMDDQYLLNCLNLVRRAKQQEEDMWYMEAMMEGFGDRA